MLKEERQRIILDEIRTHNKVHSTDLSLKLSVSEDTIRRDLKELADSGFIKKVHGGAMANPSMPKVLINPKISYKNERTIIAEKALKFIENGQVLLMDGDSTNVFLAGILPSDLIATIFTNSLQIAGKLVEYHGIETIFLGGKVSNKIRATVGLDVIHSLSEVHADIYFMEISSLHSDIGITDGNREYALTKKAMIKSASQVVALALSSDIGSIQPFKIENVAKINSLITELDIHNEQLNDFKTKGIIII